MKSFILGLGLLTSISCSHIPSSAQDSRTTTPPSMDTEAYNIPSPTPNTGYDRARIDDATQQDPEGDLAPMFPCRRGEVERHQSGKIVCVPADRADPNNTLTGR